VKILWGERERGREGETTSVVKFSTGRIADVIADVSKRKKLIR